MANLVTLQQYKDFAGLSGVKTDARINVIIPQYIVFQVEFVL